MIAPDVRISTSNRVDHRLIGETGRDDIEDLCLERMRAGPNLDSAAQIIGSRFSRRPCRPERWIRRNVNLLALCHQSVSGQRVRILAADQHPDPTDVRISRSQAAGISIRPDEFFEVCRHQFAVQVQYPAVGPDQDVAVPNTADTDVRPLGETERHIHSGN